MIGRVGKTVDHDRSVQEGFSQQMGNPKREYRQLARVQRVRVERVGVCKCGKRKIVRKLKFQFQEMKKI